VRRVSGLQAAAAAERHLDWVTLSDRIAKMYLEMGEWGSARCIVACAPLRADGTIITAAAMITDPRCFRTHVPVATVLAHPSGLTPGRHSAS
jgi:hypothetical protein